MRRLTLAVLALGCLLLAIGSFVGTKADPIAVPVLAQSTCSTGCSIEGGEDKDGHHAYCHVDHGGAGHIICPSDASIVQHFANHDQDFCIDDATTLKKCEDLTGN
jgi:hypothetical protein